MWRAVVIILISGFAAAGLGLLLGAFGLHVADATRDPDGGPTAAALDDAFMAWGFGLLGVLLVGVCASIIVWPNRPTIVGATTVVLGYAVTWLIDGVLFGPSDITTGEVIMSMLFFAPFVAVFGLLAGVIGRSAGGLKRARVG